jgi:hypothetical protein
MAGKVIGLFENCSQKSTDFLKKVPQSHRSFLKKVWQCYRSFRKMSDEIIELL